MKKFILNKIINSNAPKWLVLMIDIYITINTFILAYFIRFNFELSFDTSFFLIKTLIVFVVALLSFLLIGSYKGIVRHTSYEDSLNIVKANGIILVIMIGIVIGNRRLDLFEEFTIPLSILVIHFLLNIFILISSRLLFKKLFTFLISDLKDNRRIMIYGAGEAGLLTYSVLNDSNEIKAEVIGFIDDNKSKIGKRIKGLNVYDTAKINEAFIEKNNIHEIILAIQQIEAARLIEIVDKLSKLPVKVKIIPPVKNWIDGNLKLKQIEQVKIEDLLGRDQIVLKNKILSKELHNKIVLITGAAGSIGSEITRQISSYNTQHIILVDQAESDLYNLQQFFENKKIKNITSIVADVRNEKRMRSIFEQFKPNCVFHASAYKHVPLMEENPYEAVFVNVLGTKIIADLSLEFKIEKFVMVSTDKAVNPTNIMGATKRIAEMYISTLHNLGTTKYITTRFGNVLGSNGSVIPLFKAQIENGGPLTVTHKDMTRYFMTISEACQLVLEAGIMGNGGEIYVFDMGQSMKIYDLALKMIHLSGLKFPDDIDIEITGLRPGEKIYEELLANGESTIPTYNEKIMIAQIRELDKKTIQAKIVELCVLNQELDCNKTVVKMKEIVPEFISKNSKYEQLDIKKATNL